MRQRQRIITLFVQDAPSLLTSWKLDSFSLFFITSIKVTIRELVDVQICDQVSLHCNATTLAIWRSTWGDEFSNMTIRTTFYPYYVTNYTFESWVNNLINLYPQPTMSSSCVSHFPWNCATTEKPTLATSPRLSQCCCGHTKVSSAAIAEGTTTDRAVVTWL